MAAFIVQLNYHTILKDKKQLLTGGGFVDLELLKQFIAAAKFKNITRAAESLYMTQSALSKRIAAFEKQMGAKLLIRNNRIVELTEAGKVLYAEGQKLTAYIDEIETRVRSAQSGCSGTIRILSEPLDYDSLYNFFKYYRKSFPNIELSMKHIDFERIIGNIDNRFADAGLVRSFEVESPQYLQRYDMFRLYSTRMMVAVSADHRLASRGSIRLSELRGEQLTCLKHVIDNKSRFWENLIRRAGCVTGKELPTSIDDLIFGIRSGYYFSFVDRNSNKHYTKETGCTLIEIEDEDVSFDIVMLIAKNNSNIAIGNFKREVLLYFPDAKQIEGV